MSAPKPPRHLIDRMLADGWRGVLTATVCLGAATAVKRGVPIEDVTIDEVPGAGEHPMTAEEMARVRGALRRSYEDFKRANPREVDAAIILYTTLLREAGYDVGAGNVH